MTEHYALIAFFSVTVMSMFSLYRYLTDMIESSHDVLCDKTDHLVELVNKVSDKWEKDMHFMDQKIKDGLQSNAICCRSGLDKLNHRISLLENKLNQKDKNEPKRPTTKKTEPTV